MPTFTLQNHSAQFTGDTAGLASQDNGSITLRTKRLEVKATVQADLAASDHYYLGYVQICTDNTQNYSYGKTVDQRWEFNQLPVSDSDHANNRPWYGTDGDPYLTGNRRVDLTGPIAAADQTMHMTDDFSPKVAKLDTRADYVNLVLEKGEHLLTRIKREQSFRLWLAYVDVAQANNRASYTPLMQVDWSYKLNFSVGFAKNQALLTTNLDNPKCKAKTANFDAIPDEAFTAPIANDHQQLTYYLNDRKRHVIVARTA